MTTLSKKKKIEDAYRYSRYAPAMIPRQKLLYGEQRKRKIFDVPDNEGKDLDMEGWAFFPRPSEEEEAEEDRIQRLESEALKQIQRLEENPEDIDRETDLLVKKIKKRSRKRMHTSN